MYNLRCRWICRIDSRTKHFANIIIFYWFRYQSLKSKSEPWNHWRVIGMFQLFGRLAVRIKRKYDAIKRNRLQSRNYVSPATKHRPTAIDVTVDLDRNSKTTERQSISSSRRSFEQDDMLSYSYAEDPIINYRL